MMMVGGEVDGTRIEGWGLKKRGRQEGVWRVWHVWGQGDVVV